MLLKLLRPLIAAVFTLPLIMPAAVFRFLPHSQARFARLTMLWARVCCRIVGIRVVRSGEYEGAPSGMIVSNHVSWIDILVIGSLRPCVFVSKHEVRYWPVLGQLAMLVNTIFIERESRRASFGTLEKVTKAAASGASVVVFPEGKPSDGTGVLPFKCMLFEVPARTGVPIIPVSIAYDSPEAPWFGGMLFAPHIWRFLGVRRTTASVRFGAVISGQSGEGGRAARKSLCAESERAVREGLVRAKSMLLQKVDFEGRI